MTDRNLETTEQRRERKGRRLKDIREYRAWALRRAIELAEAAAAGDEDAQRQYDQHKREMRAKGIDL